MTAYMSYLRLVSGQANLPSDEHRVQRCEPSFGFMGRQEICFFVPPTMEEGLGDFPRPSALKHFEYEMKEANFRVIHFVFVIWT